MRPGQALKVPITLALDQYSGSSSNSSIPESLRHTAVAALAHATSMGGTPGSGLVAVKVQYPDAQQTMARDLVNLRAAAAFLSKTEIKFDLVSAVTELQKQIHLEFDFKRWVLAWLMVQYRSTCLQPEHASGCCGRWHAASWLAVQARDAMLADAALCNQLYVCVMLLHVVRER
jgi:hypothetical protein